MERARPGGPIPVRWMIALSVIAFEIRLAYVLLHPLARSLYSDMEGTFQLARDLATPGHVYTAWDVAKPRGLAVVSAFVFARLPRWEMLQVMGVLQAFLSAATVPLTSLGTRRFVGRSAAIVAAVLLSGDFLAIGYSGLLLSETYLMFFFSLAFAVIDPGRPLQCLIAGIAMGLGSLFKAQALPLALVWVAILVLWDGPKTSASSSLAADTAPDAKSGRLRGWLAAQPRVAAALFVLGLLAIKVPDSISISHAVGRGTAFPPYGGQMFFLGHCNLGELTMQGPDGLRFVSRSTKALQLHERWPNVTSGISVMDAGYYYREGWKCFTSSLPHALAWTGRQLLDSLAGPPGATLTPWPLEVDAPLLTRCWNCAFAYGFVPLALWALWRRRREPGAWLVIGGPLAAMWGVAVLFSGNPRFREPYDLFILSGAAIQLDALGGVFSRLKPFGA